MNMSINLEDPRFEQTVALYNWSGNYDARTGTPFGVFLDLIGYSEEQYGINLVEEPTKVLGYLELDYLADALKEYATRPNDIQDVIEALLEQEQN
jgi:hypothetical protein